MNKIEISKYPELKDKFYDVVIKYPTINSVISNIQNGYVYSNKNFTNLFICAKYGWSILLSEDLNEMGHLYEFLKKNLNIPDYIHLYSPDVALISYIKENWPKYKIRKRCQFKYLKKSHTHNNKYNLPSAYLIADIKDVEFSKLDVFNLDLGKRYWNSDNDFLKNAIGSCILNPHNEPVAICYSICVADSDAEIEIFVLPEYQGKGLGYIVSESFINKTIEKRLIAHWDAFNENLPSIELAKKIGFQKIQEYDLVSTFLRDW